MLAKFKSALIINFRCWHDGIWRCEIKLRRWVFDWKVEILEDFMRTIEGVIKVEGTRDSLLVSVEFWEIFLQIL